MEIYYNQARNSNTIITLGTFDGLHLGHQEIIKLTVNKAKKLDYNSALFTFNPHPLKVVSPNNTPKSLMSWKQKRRVIESLGINQIIVKKFTEEFSRIPYEDFVLEYLLNRFSVKEIIVGEDFKCGYKGKGTPDRLKKLGEKLGFGVQAIPSIKFKNKEIGSTYIRNLILEGRVDEVKEQLGRNFILDCEVIKGDQRGRKLGFPTANLHPLADYVLPPLGVYACKVRVKDKIYGGAVHLGLIPTFNKNKFSIEVYIFDFSGNIYGERIELEFIKRIRGEENFKTVEELISRMKEDVRLSKIILDKIDSL
ncbi:bifunctional riboflavin kinase/FAD synthetase [Orenia marismortui]|uniref:Riboflavin biosynthesis protein n=1 Tax=Orenia marismortui TaxID=46469 RepID=A0A4R8H9N6_9FIRM|nr:bifunctional riboflavin kinase/FAD synthetase [Orenia marismortui]TDX51878.1 FMN adenylyltransferase /riboflavin kinase [Orenia marismortui]